MKQCVKLACSHLHLIVVGQNNAHFLPTVANHCTQKISQHLAGHNLNSPQKTDLSTCKRQKQLEIASQVAAFMLVNFYNFGDKDSYPSRDLFRNPPYEISANILIIIITSNPQSLSF